MKFCKCRVWGRQILKWPGTVDSPFHPPVRHQGHPVRVSSARRHGGAQEHSDSEPRIIDSETVVRRPDADWNANLPTSAKVTKWRAP